MQTYVCPVCGYQHHGEQGIHFCPVCSTSITRFTLRNCEADQGNWSPVIRDHIRRAADSGDFVYEGKGTARRFLNMDDLVFLPAQVDRMPLLDEETVDTGVVLGKTCARPVKTRTPVLNGSMSFGALSREAKMALARASALAGGVANTGEGGMLPEERAMAGAVTLQYASGRFGITEEKLKQADMIEIKISQGAKPGMGGKLPGAKVTGEIADIRGIPPFQMSKSPARHMDIASARDLSDRIAWLRELTGGRPVGVKIAGGHLTADLAAIFDQPHIPDVLVIDGAEGGTGAAPVFVKDHVGLPLVYSLPGAADFLHSRNLNSRVTLIAAGGIRNGADAAKAIALGAEAVYMAGALKVAMGCGYIRECHLGTCPWGIATQNSRLRSRLDVEKSARRVANFIKETTAEVAALARICGKSSVHELNRSDLGALTAEVARITGVKPAWEV